MKRYVVLSLMAMLVFTAMINTTQAQQKPSERSFSAEIAKVKAMQAARQRMISQSAQTGQPQNGLSTNTQAPTNSAAPTHSTQPAATIPVLKASQKPMKVPVKAVRKTSF